MKTFSCTREAMKQKKSLQVWVFILSDYVQSPNHNHSLRHYITFNIPYKMIFKHTHCVTLHALSFTLHNSLAFLSEHFKT